MPEREATVKVVPFLIPTWAAAQTWGTYILLSRDYADKDYAPSLRLIAHELVHVDQWKKQTWAFPLKYAWELLKSGYEQNAFEVEARRWEDSQHYRERAEALINTLSI